MPERTIAIIQARMDSTRLPGKVLEDLAGRPALERTVRRCRRARCLDAVVVATSDRPVDDPVADLCQDRGWDLYRGSAHDVLDRYYRAATRFEADHIARITADCPLIDPEVIDRVGRIYAERRPDHASNFNPVRTFPRGLDCEFVPFSVLETVWQEDPSPEGREHVTEFILQHPERFSHANLVNETDLSHHRWTVDEPADLELVRRIYSAFDDDRFLLQDILEVLARHPDWSDLNAHVRQKNV